MRGLVDLDCLSVLAHLVRFRQLQMNEPTSDHVVVPTMLVDWIRKVAEHIESIDNRLSAIEARLDLPDRSHPMGSYRAPESKL